ncbi:MAG TPA: glycosyltransferase family 4 protein [Ohtaekwangia sp.]|nr:glycosyltransferase family 4 protein [Ohtaekwangia sp.]
MNILYLADPNSIHDIKWISFFSEKNLNAFMLKRNHHDPAKSVHLNKVIPVGSIADFSIFRFYRTLSTALFIKRILKKNKIDLIHILYAEPNALWCLFRFFFGIPMIVTTRGTDVLKTIPESFEKSTGINFLVSRLYKKSFLNADWVTGTSLRQLESIESFSTRKENMSVVRTGIEVRYVESDTSSFSSVEGPFLLFPRYIRRLYNHEFCLDAIEQLPSNVKKNYKMVFVGKDSGDAGYQSYLESRMYSLRDVQFVFLPLQSQEAIIELYKRASLVIMTPKSDGSPVSAMEAIACGAKVILGPLRYDAELYKDYVFQLNTWSSNELTTLIQDALKAEGKRDIKSFLKSVDRRMEMDKIYMLYKKLLKIEVQ